MLGQHRRSDAEARVVRSDVRRPRRHAGARPRPHRLAADARCQPVGIERQPLHRPRLPRPGEGHPGARRQGRRRRPPAHPHRRRGRRARGHPAGHRRPPAAGHGQRGAGRGARRRRCRRRPQRRPGRPARRGRRLHPRGGRPGHRRPCRRHPPPGPRDGRGAHRRRLRPHRHPHGGVRDAGGLGRRRPQPGHRQPRLARWRHVAAGRPQPAAGRRGRRSGLHHRSLDQQGAGVPRGPGRDPRGHAGRRDGDAGRGPGPCPRHHRRQPGAVDTRRRSPRRRPRAPRLPRGRRPVHQRDLAPRRRDPAAAVDPHPGPLRPGLLRAGRAQRGQLLAAGPARRRRHARARDPGPPVAHRLGPGSVGRPGHRRRPDVRRPPGVAARAHPAPRSPTGTTTRSARPSPTTRPRSAWST